MSKPVQATGTPYSIVVRAEGRGPVIGKPYFRHATEESAVGEALRLSMLHDEDFLVLTVRFVVNSGFALSQQPEQPMQFEVTELGQTAIAAQQFSQERKTALE